MFWSRLFSTAFTPKSMWGSWEHANRQVLVTAVTVSVLSLVVAVEQGYGYYRYQTVTSAWQWLYLPILLLGGFWYVARARAIRIYDAFLREVEQRKKGEQNTTLSEAKQGVLRQFHRLSGWQLWKGASVLLFGVWAVAYTHHELGRMNLKEPVRLSIQIKQGITHKQAQIAQLAITYCNLYTSLKQHQARITALKRMATQTQSSIQEQRWNLYQGQGARAQLSQAQYLLQTTPQTLPAQQIRNNPAVFQIIKGQTEIYLFLQNKEAQASDAILAQDDRLMTSFEDVQVRYDRHLHLAQKSVYRDQKKLQDFEKELKKEEDIVQRMIIALADNQKLRAKLLRNIQRDLVYWQKRMRLEKRLDHERLSHHQRTKP